MTETIKPAITEKKDKKRGTFRFAAMAVVLALLCAGFLRVREHIHRAICLGHFKSIGLAIRMYAGDNDRWFPSELSLLVSKDFLTVPQCYVCPSTDTQEAPVRLFSDANVKNKVAFDLTGYCDYDYLGSGLRDDYDGHDFARTIVMHDQVGNHRRFFNVLFANGAVRGYCGNTIEDIAKREGLLIPASPSGTETPKRRGKANTKLEQPAGADPAVRGAAQP